MPFYGYNRPGAKVSEGVRDAFWLQGMMAGIPASYFCIKAFSETDLTEDLKKFDVPTLILHGDDDQIVPIGASAMLSVEDRQGREAQGLQGRRARHVYHSEERRERRPAGVHQRVVVRPRRPNDRTAFDGTEASDRRSWLRRNPASPALLKRPPRCPMDRRVTSYR